MAKPRQAAVRQELRKSSLTLKISHEERERLRRITVARERELLELTGQRLELKPSDIVRWLLDKESVARGLLGPQGPSTHANETVAAPTVMISMLERVPVSSSLPAVLEPSPPPVPLPKSPMQGALGEEPTMISEEEGAATVPGARASTSASLVKNPNLLRETLDKEIGAGKFRQRDVADASGLPRGEVSRFLRGDDLDSKRLRRLGFALVKLQR